MGIEIQSDCAFRLLLHAPFSCYVVSLRLKSSQNLNRACSFSHLYSLLFLVSLLVWDCVSRPEFSCLFIVTVKCCLSLHSDCGVLLLCCACLLDCLFSFSLFSVLTVCSGPALGNTRSYKLLDWNSVTAGISPLLLLSPTGVMAAQWSESLLIKLHPTLTNFDPTRSHTSTSKFNIRLTVLSLQTGEFSELPFSSL